MRIFYFILFYFILFYFILFYFIINTLHHYSIQMMMMRRRTCGLVILNFHQMAHYLSLLVYPGKVQHSSYHSSSYFMYCYVIYIVMLLHFIIKIDELMIFNRAVQCYLHTCIHIIMSLYDSCVADIATSVDRPFCRCIYI